MQFSKLSLFLLVLLPVVLLGEGEEAPLYETPAVIESCVSGTVLSIECAEQIIKNFSGDNWFIHHNLSELNDQDLAFLRGYLTGRRLELWGELGTPAMVDRQKLIMPIKSGVMLCATALGLAAASFTAGSISAKGIESSIVSGYLSDSAFASILLGVSVLSGAYYFCLKQMSRVFNEKKERLESVEELLKIIEG